MQLTDLANEILPFFPDAEERDIGSYSLLKWPKLLPMMKLKVHSYRVPDFGFLMTMETNAMGGMMKLTTMSFMPSEGISVPFLLIDTMTMSSRRLAYVEFYDTRADRTPMSSLTELREDYSHVQDYAEKPAWYVGERMEGSLIKCGDPTEEEVLCEMVLDAVIRYRDAVSDAGTDRANLAGLGAFVERMVREGNPSSATLEKILGKDGAEDFFRRVVMPMEAE